MRQMSLDLKTTRCEFGLKDDLLLQPEITEV